MFNPFMDLTDIVEIYQSAIELSEVAIETNNPILADSELATEIRQISTHDIKEGVLYTRGSVKKIGSIDELGKLELKIGYEFGGTASTVQLSFGIVSIGKKKYLERKYFPRTYKMTSHYEALLERFKKSEICQLESIGENDIFFSVSGHKVPENLDDMPAFLTKDPDEAIKFYIMSIDSIKYQKILDDKIR
jgi:hypothetical protein